MFKTLVKISSSPLWSHESTLLFQIQIYCYKSNRTIYITLRWVTRYHYILIISEKQKNISNKYLYLYQGPLPEERRMF
jgi:hypothetical protein